MKYVPPGDQFRVREPHAGGRVTSTEAEVLRLRMVHRAAADLRRGTPVLLTGDSPLALLGAETAGPRGLAELAALAAEPPVLLLAAMRAAAVLHRPVEADAPVVALRLGEALLAPGPLRGLADPTIEDLLPSTPEPADVPQLALPALTLAKLGRLLPAGHPYQLDQAEVCQLHLALNKQQVARAQAEVLNVVEVLQFVKRPGDCLQMAK